MANMARHPGRGCCRCFMKRVSISCTRAGRRPARPASASSLAASPLAGGRALVRGLLSPERIVRALHALQPGLLRVRRRRRVARGRAIRAVLPERRVRGVDVRGVRAGAHVKHGLWPVARGEGAKVVGPQRAARRLDVLRARGERELRRGLDRAQKTRARCLLAWDVSGSWIHHKTGDISSR